MTATLLVEIGVEELPPKAMRPLADALANGLAGALSEAGLGHGAVTRYATPRRLAVSVADTATETQPRAIKKAGPTVAMAFDAQGNPTRAGTGFARSLGVALAVLEREDSDRGERLVYRGKTQGQPLAALLQGALEDVLRALPIPKRMRWGKAEYSFVRPVHWLVAMHGKQVLPLELFGIIAGRATPGHRFHHPEPIELGVADDYASALSQNGYVIADPDIRTARMVDQVRAAAESLGGQAVIDPELVEEVAALVEWPVAVAGTFERRFLALPREVLIATLEDHQRYFPIENADRALIAGFVTVANIESLDPAQVVAGNERVIRARLADALFFWDYDRRVGLESHIEGLARVSFQQALGSLADKTQRVRSIAKHLAEARGADTALVDRAALLAKTDLLTEMVGEFPELQGIMGGYYASDAGEPAAVAQAIAEQYAPAAAGSPIPATDIGRIVGIADRIDTLAGIFAIGKRPSGDKDPFALRRIALGLLRILIEAEIDLDLEALIARSLSLQPVATDADVKQSLWLFHVERLRGYYSERDLPAGVFEAVAAAPVSDILDFDRRLGAVAAFTCRAKANTVVGALKRIRNILRRTTTQPATVLDDTLLVEPAERELAAVLRHQQKTTTVDIGRGDYAGVLSDLATLASPLDHFFNQVMVMSDDLALRGNRLALLRELDVLCGQVADLSYLTVKP